MTQKEKINFTGIAYGCAAISEIIVLSMKYLAFETMFADSVSSWFKFMDTPVKLMIICPLIAFFAALITFIPVSRMITAGAAAVQLIAAGQAKYYLDYTWKYESIEQSKYMLYVIFSVIVIAAALLDLAITLARYSKAKKINAEKAKSQVPQA